MKSRWHLWVKKKVPFPPGEHIRVHGFREQNATSTCPLSAQQPARPFVAALAQPRTDRTTDRHGSEAGEPLWAAADDRLSRAASGTSEPSVCPLAGGAPALGLVGL